MKLRVSTTPQHALSLVEVVVIVAVLALLALWLLPSLARMKKKAQIITCNGNLKGVGLSFRIWQGDRDPYQMRHSVTNGGTLEWVASGEVWPHFQVMSNELSTPRVLTCPADLQRTASSSFRNLGSSNLSYFVGVDAEDTQPQMLLSGDSNFEVDGKPVGPGLLNLWTNSGLGWTADRHALQGNIALADVSVQQLNNIKLRKQLACSGVATNRLAIP